MYSFTFLFVFIFPQLRSDQLNNKALINWFTHWETLRVESRSVTDSDKHHEKIRVKESRKKTHCTCIDSLIIMDHRALNTIDQV